MQQTPSYSMDDVEESQISRLALTVEKGQTKTRLIWKVGKEQRNSKSSTTLEKPQTKTELISLLGNWYKIDNIYQKTQPKCLRNATTAVSCENENPKKERM